MARTQLFRRVLEFAVCAAFALSVAAPIAFAEATYRPAKLIVSDRSGEYIGGLNWDSYDLPIQVVKQDDTRQAFVQLHGSLQTTDQNLVLGQQQVPLNVAPGATSSTFEVAIPLQGKVSILNFFTVDAYGRTQHEKVAIVFPDWKSFSLPLTKNMPLHRWHTSVGLGLSDEHYQEAGVIDMNELGLTGKFNVSYRLAPSWELGGNTFFTLLPIPISIPDGEPAARWYGINGRVAYKLPIDSIPATQLWVMSGWYVWGMIVNASSQNSYGVAYLGGPQLFINARITPPGKRASWVYLKYASISDGLQIFSTTNRELAIGGGMEISKPGAKHPWSGTLDIADAQFSNATNALHLFSLSLGVSVGL